MEDPRALADYEVLELLLGLCQRPPRQQTPGQGAVGPVRHPAGHADWPGWGNCGGWRVSVPGLEEFLTLWREAWARFHEQPLRDRVTFNSPDIVAEAAKARLGTAEHEEFWMALLDNKNRLIGWERISKGTVDQAAVYPREVLGRGAGPQGQRHHPRPQPSRVRSPSPPPQDIEFTRRIRQAAHELDVRVLDHLVVTDNRFFSFPGRGHAVTAS